MSQETRDERRQRLIAEAAVEANREAHRQRAYRDYLDGYGGAAALDRDLGFIEDGMWDDRVNGFPCGCGCGEQVHGPTGRSRYIDVNHRQRAARRRLEAEAKRAGVPVRLSRQALQTATRTRERNGDAPAPRKRRQARPREGVTVYLPTVAAAAESLERTLAAFGDRHAEALDVVRAALARRRSRDTRSGADRRAA